MDPGFPRLIRADWAGIPRRVDAAFKLEGKIKRIQSSRCRVSVYSGEQNPKKTTEIEVCNFFVCKFVGGGWGLLLMEHFYTSTIIFRLLLLEYLFSTNAGNTFVLCWQEASSSSVGPNPTSMMPDRTGCWTCSQPIPWVDVDTAENKMHYQQVSEEERWQRRRKTELEDETNEMINSCLIGTLALSV